MKSAMVLCAALVALLPALAIGSVEVSPNDEWQGLRALQRKGKGKGKGKGNGSSAGGQCGLPIDKCKAKGGRCMPKDECVKQLGDLAGWVPGKGLCKTPKPNEECGCCYKRDKPDPNESSEPEESKETIPEDLELVPHGIAMAVGESETVHLTFEWTEEGIKGTKILGLGDGWSFNAYAGAMSKPECDETGCNVEIRGDAFHPKLDKIFEPIPVEEPEGSHGRLLQGEKPHAPHIFTSEMVPSLLRLTFPNALTTRLVGELREDPSKPVEVKGTLDLKLELMPTKEQSRYINTEPIARVQWPFEIRWRLVVPKITENIFAPWWLREVNKNLCVQPVRTRYRKCLFEMFGTCWIRSPTYTYSGDGLAFGRPMADSLWGQVDITFTWRPWITVDDTTGKYQSLTEGAEMTDLRNEVSEDDCVEVFFVKKFSPSSTYGGGACWSSGTANAKIISSDEQVACGVDKTHLAHELGHALGLMHPGTGHATLPDGSSGTLLCGSGWQRDNPRRNSRDNGNNAVNPLLVTYFDSWDIDTPACTSSADCGSCSAHIPSDSC
jgi:hypothetical protein